MSNNFLADYSNHDLLQSYLESKLELVGLEVEQYGTDDRTNDLERGYGPDIAVKKDDELLCYIEVKSKRESSDDWFGRLDRHHFEDYLKGDNDGFFEGAEHIDEDVYIYFGVIDEDNGLPIRDGFIPVRGEEQITEGFKCYGDVIVTLDTVDCRNFNWLYNSLLE